MYKEPLITANERSVILCIITMLLSLGSVNAQKYLKITDLKNNETFTIRKNSLIQCRYLAYKQHDVLISGIVYKITDSSLVYKATTFSPKREIKLASIVNIDKCMLRRVIIPSLVSGAIFSEVSISLIPSKTPETLSIIGTAAAILPLIYVLHINHRHLNKNKVGSVVSMDVMDDSDKPFIFNLSY